MARKFDIKITTGTAPGPYNVYYNSVAVGNIATITSSSLPATGVTYSTLTTGTGLNVTIPDATTAIILYNVQCSSQISYTFPTPTPTPTPTNTPTPTPTPTPDPYVYYNANVGTCTDCGPAPVPTEHIKFLAPFTPTTGKVYIPSTFLGYFYSNLTSISTDLSARLMSSTEYSGCATACGFTPTPTPTPTATPTATPTRTPTPTPTSTPIPVYSFAGYSGTTAAHACDNSSGVVNLYYTGTLGVGTVLYNENTLSTVVDDGYYFYNETNVYHVGFPSTESGGITAIVSCPAPTPTPTPTGAGYYDDGYGCTYHTSDPGAGFVACTPGNQV